MAEKQDERPKSVDVYELITVMLEQTASVCWQKLGLQHDTISGKLEPDLNQAKVAIDLTAYLAQLIEPELDQEDRRRVQGLVRDLRINFVQKNTEV